jgi:plastocyanin
MKKMNKTLCVMTAVVMLGPMAFRAEESKTAPAASTAVKEIDIANFTFGPDTLTIPVGTTVKWTNEDDTIHRVKFTDLDALSKALDTDDNFTYTFRKPGKYHYFCPLHPKMTGTVIVTEGPSKP